MQIQHGMPGRAAVACRSTAILAVTDTGRDARATKGTGTMPVPRNPTDLTPLPLPRVTHFPILSIGSFA